MTKIGIITLYGNENFGNKLQNYALQEFLKKISTNNEVYSFKIKDKKIISTLKRFIKKSKMSPREKKFRDFNRFINYEKKAIDMHSPHFSKKYDYLIFGSDQIWNTNFEGKEKVFIGDFFSEAKKISYAASFGISSLPTEYKEEYQKSLTEFKNISVREEDGQKIIKNELKLNRDIPVLIDPTMLLNKEDWDKVLQKPNNFEAIIQKKYILNYFLGELSEIRKNEIKRIAKENNCQIINILDKKNPFYNCGPSEFLFLEKNAYLVCTDSFHSCIFALLYDRPFVVFERDDKSNNKMNSRIETLLSKFSLKNRKFIQNRITENNIKHDYSISYSILEKERKKSEEYLKKSLQIK